MSQENVDAVRSLWDAWERGDVESVFEIYDPAVVWDQPSKPSD
jgi:ketosteroid isomerase-like protein